MFVSYGYHHNVEGLQKILQVSDFVHFAIQDNTIQFADSFGGEGDL